MQIYIDVISILMLVNHPFLHWNCRQSWIRRSSKLEKKKNKTNKMKENLHCVYYGKFLKLKINEKKGKRAHPRRSLGK